MALPSFWDTFLAAIRAQESGGNYTTDTAGCLGAYCWNAQSNWDTMAADAGQSKYVGVNPSQVPANIQDTVASSNLYKIYQQTGSLAAAARWWNGGSTQSETNPGLPAQPWAPSCGGGSSEAYACQVLRRMALGGHYVAGGGSGSGGVVTTAAAADVDCALGFSSGNINPIPSWVPGLGGNVSTQLCFLTKPAVRAIYGALLIVGGSFLVIIGLAFTVGFTGPGRKVLTVITKTPTMPSGGGSGKPAGGAQAPSPPPSPPSSSTAVPRPGDYDENYFSPQAVDYRKSLQS